MSALFYFGAHPNGNQKASDEVRSKGLNLLKVPPSAVFPIITRTYTHPSYEAYCLNFHLMAKAAVTKTAVALSNEVQYYALPTKTTPSCFGTPNIVWSYEEKKDADFLQDIRDRFNATEVQAKGRPAFYASLNPTQAASLMKTNPSKYTACSTTTLNLDAYLNLLRIERLADLYLRVNQYPLVAYDNDDVSKIANFVQVDTLATAFKATAAGSYALTVTNNMKFHGNLPSEPKDVDYYVRGKSDLPNDGGMLFPFVPELAREDDSTVIRTIERYFFNLLGDDCESATTVFAGLKSAWGNIKDTVWGDMISHLYAGIEISFQTGGMMDLMVSQASLYNGFVITGGDFILTRGDREYTPVKYADLQTLFDKASPHRSSLTQILAKLNFPSDIERQGALGTVTSNYDVGLLCRTYGYDMLERENIKRLAQDLCFARDQFLPVTSVNISRVFAAISSTTETESTFPLHRLAILETDRTKRLLSAFGAYCPSFLIPGGRTMSLESGSFSYTIQAGQGKKKVSKVTTRVFCQIVPWDVACNHLATVLAEKHVLSPIGTAIASRASTRSLIREFEGVNGAQVLTSLRTLVGVTVSEGSGAGGKKRRADDEGEGGSSKKSKMAESMDF